MRTDGLIMAATYILSAGAFAHADRSGDSSRRSATARTFAKTMVAYARTQAKCPILRRPKSAADVSPEFLDTRVPTLSGSRKEYFALSMADTFETQYLAHALPAEAVGACESGDPILLKHVVDQLDEMTRWSPLNRPGWTLYLNGPEVPADFNDGNWLGTGFGIRAIVSTLDCLGDKCPDNIRAKANALLSHEIAGVMDDFRTHRAWYTGDPTSNQFILPNTGVLIAGEHLGPAENAPAIEFATENLLKSLAVHGADGAFREGTRYGGITTIELLTAALAAARNRDRRLIDSPYLSHCDNWLIHLFQPNRLVNFFDGPGRRISFDHDLNSHAFGSLAPTDAEMLVDCLALCATARGTSQAGRFLDLVMPSLYPSAPCAKLRMHQNNSTGDVPLTYAAFHSSPLVTWRSGWGPSADGVWARGHSAGDSHDHQDDGHINYIVAGREVLIEAGSGDYADPLYEEHYTAGSAHNVLQIGNTPQGRQRKGSGGPITVTRLDTVGGEVTVDPTGDYDHSLLRSWTRKVRWDGDGLIINDAVEFAAGAPNTGTLFFHIGTNAPIQLTPSNSGDTWTAVWPGGKIVFSSDTRLTVAAELEVHDLAYTKTGHHMRLTVTTGSSVNRFMLTTSLKRKDFPPAEGVKGDLL